VLATPPLGIIASRGRAAVAAAGALARGRHQRRRQGHPRSSPTRATPAGTEHAASARTEIDYCAHTYSGHTDTGIGVISRERAGTRPHHDRAGQDGWQPCISLRFPVVTVLRMVAGGMSVNDIVGEHPDLEPEDIPAALNYAAEALAEHYYPLRPPA
jgi:uncharacterized protein (DUF433 family)